MLRRAVMTTLTFAALAAGTTACGPRGPATLAGSPDDPLAEVTIPPVPAWTDKYANQNKGDVRFFRMSAVMQRNGLTRLQAVELQNHYRDLTRQAGQAEPKRHFQEALGKVQRGELESRMDPNTLAQAKFIVVFDLDDTLYDQYGKAVGPDCSDFAVKDERGQTRHVKLNPGWQAVFERVRSLGGKIVLFSANQDEPTWRNLMAWQWENTPIARHPDVAGVLTNSYLIRQEKTEPPGSEDRPQTPVVEPSKDLRIFDETLQRVILVDDNPSRVFQYRNLRWFKKFHAADLCGDDANGRANALLAEKQMSRVMAEITDAVAYAEAHPKAGFAVGYLPYSMLGRSAAQALMDANGWSFEQAATYLREHPDVVERKF